MATLGSTYKGKDKSDTSITVVKSFMVSADRLVLDTTYNVRGIDQEHAEGFRDSFLKGRPVPALKVAAMGDGHFRIIDGQHTYTGGMMAGVERFKCEDAPDGEKEHISLMLRTASGKPLTAVQRAVGYHRQRGLGMTPDEIAEEACRSRSDVDNHLALFDAGVQVMQLVDEGRVSYVQAIDTITKHQDKAEIKLVEAVAKAESRGQRRASDSDLGRFTAKMGKTLLERIKGHSAFQSIIDDIAGEEDGQDIVALLEAFETHLAQRKRGNK